MKENVYYLELILNQQAVEKDQKFIAAEASEAGFRLLAFGEKAAVFRAIFRGSGCDKRAKGAAERLHYKIAPDIEIVSACMRKASSAVLYS